MKKFCAIVWNFFLLRKDYLEITKAILFGKENPDVDRKNKILKAFCYFKL
jgi:hypothetical protein